MKEGGLPLSPISKQRCLYEERCRTSVSTQAKTGFVPEHLKAHPTSGLSFDTICIDTQLPFPYATIPQKTKWFHYGLTYQVSPQQLQSQVN